MGKEMNPGKIKLYRRDGKFKVLAVIEYPDGTESMDYFTADEIAAAMAKMLSLRENTYEAEKKQGG